MEEEVDSNQQLMVEGGLSSPHCMQIDPEGERFPCCIVWTPLPVLSWFIPFIGHLGICRENGIILDFAGSNYVNVGNFAFGAVARYIQIDPYKECNISLHPSAFNGEEEHWHDGHGREISTWDDVVRKSTQEFQHLSYSLFSCNCHSFVANSLNRSGFRSAGWNVVNLAALMFLKGRWVSKTAFVRSFLPFIIVTTLGLAFGGTTYLTFLVLFAFLLVGWFLIGTYCFKNLIHL